MTPQNAVNYIVALGLVAKLWVMVIAHDGHYDQ